MATNHAHGNNNPSVTYDKSDLGARGIFMFFVALGAFAVVMHLVVLGMWIGLNKVAEKRDPETHPLAGNTVTPRSEVLMNTANINVQKFPEPRLQNDDTGDMQRFLLKESDALNAAPWQDEKGNVHLPIDQAMSAALTRLPVRAGGRAPSNHPGAGAQYSYPTAVAEKAVAETAVQAAEPAAEGK